MSKKNGTTIARAYVQVLPSMEGIQGQLRQALDGPLDSVGRSAGSRLGGALKGGLVTAAKVGVAGFAALAGAGTAVAGAFAGAAKASAEYGDTIDKMSQKMGLSAVGYQEWDAVMQHSGTSMEALKAGMKTLATAAEKGNDAFAALGITQEQIAGMDQEGLFNATIAALQSVENETQRTYLAGQLLGRGATELGPLLNTSAEETQAMKDRLHELGGVMSDESVKAAARFQDSLQDMKTSMDGLKRSLAEGFLPSMADVMDGIGSVVSGADVEGGLAQIEAGVNGFIDHLGEVIPRVFALGGRIIPAFARAIVQAIPKLANAALEMIRQLGDYILNAASGEGSGQLAQAIGRVVLAIGRFIIQAVPVLAEAALKIIAALAMFLISGAAELLKTGAQLVAKVGEGIKNAAQAAFTWGRDLIKNFIDGILSKLADLWNTIKGVGQGIRDFIGFSEPKKGPLSVFHEFAPDMMELYAKGIRENKHLITDEFRDGLELDAVVRQAAVVQMPQRFAGYESQRDDRTVRPQPEARNLTVVLELDRMQLGRAVYRLNEEETQRVGVKLARGYA